MADDADAERARDVRGKMRETLLALDRAGAANRLTGPILVADRQPAVELLTRLDVLFADSDLLRAYAASVDPLTKTVRIKSPNYFFNSIKMRRDLLETAIAALREVWDLKNMLDFYDAIVDEVAQESPECAARIMTRLNELNQKRMFAYGRRSE